MVLESNGYRRSSVTWSPKRTSPSSLWTFPIREMCIRDRAEAVRALVRLGGAEQPVRLFLPLARVGVDHAQHQQPLLRAGAHGDVPVHRVLRRLDRVVQRVAKQRAQVRVGDRQFFRQEDADIQMCIRDRPHAPEAAVPLR